MSSDNRATISNDYINKREKKKKRLRKQRICDYKAVNERYISLMFVGDSGNTSLMKEKFK